MKLRKKSHLKRRRKKVRVKEMRKTTQLRRRSKRERVRRKRNQNLYWLTLVYSVKLWSGLFKVEMTFRLRRKRKGELPCSNSCSRKLRSIRRTETL